MSFLIKSLKAIESNLLIASINRSNTPVITAIVPPDTPGITFAAPIINPLVLFRINSFIYDYPNLVLQSSNVYSYNEPMSIWEGIFE